MLDQRHSINEVFTPRKPEVNPEIYVDREALERQLIRALRGSLHTVIFGESGSGKSWLYKKVLADLKARTITANCANALRYQSLTEEIRLVVAAEEPKQLSELTEGGSASLAIPVLGAGIKAERKYTFSEKDPLIDCFRILRKRAGDEVPAVLVIDNLEMIFSSEELMQELASIIILLDDSSYAAFKVKLLIVGVPSDVKRYLSSRHASVANRLTEISEVSSLSEAEVSTLVQKGFVDLLKVDLDPSTLSNWQRHIFHITMGLPQPIHEYCEQLGYILEDANWKAAPRHIADADLAWLKEGLSHSSGMVASWMNERDTRVGRRNQVLYVLGQLEKKVFHVNEVETSLRSEFAANTAADTTLAIGQILSEMTSGEASIIKRSLKGPTYEFRDARAAMALRVLLQKDTHKGTISRKNDV